VSAAHENEITRRPRGPSILKAGPPGAFARCQQALHEQPSLRKTLAACIDNDGAPDTLLSEAKLHFRRSSNGRFWPSKHRKCFIFQWGLTHTLSATLRYNSPLDPIVRIYLQTTEEFRDEFFAQAVVLRRRFGGCFSLETTCPSRVSRSPPRWRGSDLAGSNTGNVLLPAGGGTVAALLLRGGSYEAGFPYAPPGSQPGDQAESRLGRSHRARIPRFSDSEIEPAVAAWG
jgi:hypothetical protein